MKKILHLAGALALVLFAAPAFAQTPPTSAGPLCKNAWGALTPCQGVYLTDGSGNATTGNPIPAGENHIGEVAGRTALVGATFTTTSATTAWSANQGIMNSATAGSVTPLTFSVCRVNGGTGMVRRVRIKVASDTGFAGQSITLKLHRDAPTYTNGDRATWLVTDSNLLGQFNVTLDQHLSDFEKGIGAPSVGSEVNFDCASGSQNIYGELVSNGTITPQAGSKAVTVVLEVLQN